LRDFVYLIFSRFHLRLWLEVVLVFLFPSVILLVELLVESIMLNHYSINYLINSNVLHLTDCSVHTEQCSNCRGSNEEGREE